MLNKTFRLGPVALTTSAANILNGAVTSMAGPVGITLPQPVLTLKHIRVGNKTGAAVTVTLYIGVTGGSAAGTEFAFVTTSIPANGFADWNGTMPLASTDFLTGIASAGTAITLNAEGEMGFQ
jgi:hypothetical protein